MSDMKDTSGGKNEIEELKAIHYKMRSFLDIKDYEGARRYMRTISDTHDINKMHTIIILTTSFVNHPILKEERYKLYQRFNAALGQVHQEWPMFKSKDPNVPSDQQKPKDNG